MSQKKRHQQIITKLNIDGQVFVKELATSFGVTEDCIRKDLTLLEKAGKLKRVHGGAVNVRVNLHHTNVSERVELYSKENLPNGTYFIKEKNGYYAADLNDTNYSNYRYLTKNEFLTNNETENWHELKEEINDDYIIQNYFNKEPENPHAVNPFYVKKIEALK